MTSNRARGQKSDPSRSTVLETDATDALLITIVAGMVIIILFLTIAVFHKVGVI